MIELERGTEMNYAGIIRQSRLRLKMSQEELASLVGVTRNAVASWETSHSRPDLDTVPVLCKALKISLSTFFNIRRSARSRAEQEFLDLFCSLNEEDRKVVLWEMESLAQHRAEELTANTLASFIPCYESDLDAAAGFGSTLQSESGKQIWIRAGVLTEQADEVITVSGHSMEPTFPDGAQVLVRHCSSVKPGEIGIFISDDVGYIKEYRADGLHSHNPAYPVMKFGEDSAVRCVGKVLGILEASMLPDEAELKILEESIRNQSGKKVRS